MLYGASILPFCVDPKFNIPYFWLGQEQYVQDWSNGSLSWSDFGGRREQDEDAEACASREFEEESLNAIIVGVDAAIMTARLRAGNYVARIDATSENGGVYTTFIVQVPWDPATAVRFADERHALQSGTLDPRHPAWVDGVISPHFCEKIDIRLWSSSDIRYCMYRRFKRRKIRYGCVGRLRTALDFIDAKMKLKWCVTAPISRLLSVNKQTNYVEGSLAARDATGGPGGGGADCRVLPECAEHDGGAV